jgi:post-segregation antitoxin (ccd killing protein)
MNPDIQAYNLQQTNKDQVICNVLATCIDRELKEASSKIWHAHPVWFLNDNPVVGYSKQKKGIRLMFWSGADFDELNLNVRGEKFKDASIFYTDVNQLVETDIYRWIRKSREIQWDYKNLIKRKGKLEKLT